MDRSIVFSGGQARVSPDFYPVAYRGAVDALQMGRSLDPAEVAQSRHSTG